MYQKKTSIFKILYAIFSWTVGPKRVSFSGLGVLTSTPSPEKDSHLRPMVHEKIAYQIFKMEIFFGSPFIYCQWLMSGTVPDRYPVFFTCPTTRSIKIVCPTGIEFSKSSNQYPAGQCNGLSLCHIYRPEHDREEEVLQEDSTESDSDEFDM